MAFGGWSSGNEWWLKLAQAVSSQRRAAARAQEIDTALLALLNGPVTPENHLEVAQRFGPHAVKGLSGRDEAWIQNNLLGWEHLASECPGLLSPTERSALHRKRLTAEADRGRRPGAPDSDTDQLIPASNEAPFVMRLRDGRVYGSASPDAPGVDRVILDVRYGPQPGISDEEAEAYRAARGAVQGPGDSGSGVAVIMVVLDQTPGDGETRPNALLDVMMALAKYAPKIPVSVAKAPEKLLPYLGRCVAARHEARRAGAQISDVNTVDAPWEVRQRGVQGILRFASGREQLGVLPVELGGSRSRRTNRPGLN